MHLCFTVHGLCAVLNTLQNCCALVQRDQGYSVFESLYSRLKTKFCRNDSDKRVYCMFYQIVCLPDNVVCTLFLAPCYPLSSCDIVI